MREALRRLGWLESEVGGAPQPLSIRKSTNDPSYGLTPLPVYHAKAFHRLLALRPAALRQRLLRQIEWPADNPYHRGDFEVPDDTGRDAQILIYEAWTITYWADHAVKELRVVDVKRQTR